MDWTRGERRSRFYALGNDATRRATQPMLEGSDPDPWRGAFNNGERGGVRMYLRQSPPLHQRTQWFLALPSAAPEEKARLRCSDTRRVLPRLDISTANAPMFPYSIALCPIRLRLSELKYRVSCKHDSQGPPDGPQHFLAAVSTFLKTRSTEL